MLGLGDIVIPGMMVGFALRFDLYLHYMRKGIRKALAENGGGFVKPYYQSATGGWGERFWTGQASSPAPGKLELEPPYRDAKSFPKTYFYASVVGYTTGMIATLVVMQYSSHAQPALLYLVPGVLISLWGTALWKGDVREMWEFADTDDDEDEEGQKKQGSSDKEEEEKPKTDTAKGLFLRLLRGDTTVFSADASNKKPPEVEKSTDKEKKESGKREDKSSDLFFVSVSFPQKGSRTRDPARSQAADRAVQSVPSWSDTQAKDEPPGKRLRRSIDKEDS